MPKQTSKTKFPELSRNKKSFLNYRSQRWNALGAPESAFLNIGSPRVALCSFSYTVATETWQSVTFRDKEEGLL